MKANKEQYKMCERGRREDEREGQKGYKQFGKGEMKIWFELVHWISSIGRHGHPSGT